MQLNLFQPQIKQPQQEQPKKTGKIIPRFSFDRSAEPIGLPDFHRDMLLKHRDDPLVFKSCPDCGAMYAFNTQMAYDSFIVCYGCQRKMWARQMNWGPPKKTFEGDKIFDWETSEEYRFGEGESFGATLDAEQSHELDPEKAGGNLGDKRQA